MEAIAEIVGGILIFGLIVVFVALILIAFSKAFNVRIVNGWTRQTVASPESWDALFGHSGQNSQDNSTDIATARSISYQMLEDSILFRNDPLGAFGPRKTLLDHFEGVVRKIDTLSDSERKELLELIEIQRASLDPAA